MLRKLLKNSFLILVWLGLWAAAAALVNQTLLLPSPLETARAFASLAESGAFWLAAALSMSRILSGFALGVAAGSALAVLSARSPWGQAFFSPLLSVVKSTPVASFILLALVWIRTSGVPVFATFLIVLPIAYANVLTGIASTDPLLLEMGRAFGMKRRALLSKIYWPSVRPSFLAAVTTGMGMAWKAGVAAEVICTPKNALGSLLYDAKIYLDTPGLFAATAAVILLSVLLEKLVLLLAYGREGRKAHA